MNPTGTEAEWKNLEAAVMEELRNGQRAVYALKICMFMIQSWINRASLSKDPITKEQLKRLVSDVDFALKKKGET